MVYGRQGLAVALCAAVACVPAVALAASADEKTHEVTGQVGGPTPTSDKRQLARERAYAMRKRAARAAAAPVAIPAHLQAIAACESGGNPRAIGGGGQYRGAFQMTYATWASVGGSGDPAAAPMAEQVRRAETLYATAGPGQWPVCSN
jgi:hypothetical protein